MQGIRPKNGVALAAATLCRVRNPKASALHYRISTVLLHSGTKDEDLVRLNRLGVCMSPDSTIRFQRKMGEQLEGKVKLWKKAIEENKAAVLLCEEIEKKQIPALDFHDMQIVVNVDLAEETLKSYDNFTECLQTRWTLHVKHCATIPIPKSACVRLLEGYETRPFPFAGRR